ncbi:hypothetical protein, partial [Nocardiopsis sp. CC223A]|uniref:hypothetical protein n=1 Tax=Nocardiopsis sp. CC223A TaxID=3044051 RepID=UPI00278C1571
MPVREASRHPHPGEGPGAEQRQHDRHRGRGRSRRVGDQRGEVGEHAERRPVDEHREQQDDLEPGTAEHRELGTRTRCSGAGPAAAAGGAAALHG